VAALEQIETAGTGLASLAQAQTFGFNRPKGTTSGAAGPAIIGIVGEPAFGQAVQLSPAYAEALYGFSPRGGAVGRRPCLQQASQAVYGPLNGEPVPDPVPRIAVQAVSFTRTDPRILAAGRAWAKCMARHFYRYTSPARAESRPWPSAPDKAEIATAVADVLCKTRVNYVNTWLTVEAAYQQALIRQNLAALAQLQANFAPLLRRAQAALTAPALTAPAAPPPRG
jgi:hypothetical protein